MSVPASVLQDMIRLRALGSLIEASGLACEEHGDWDAVTTAGAMVRELTECIHEALVNVEQGHQNADANPEKTLTSTQG